MNPQELQRIIAEAKAKLARSKTNTASQPATLVVPAPAAPAPLAPVSPSWQWNEQQRKAITYAMAGKSFVLIGSAGTGKTTVTRGMLREKIETQSIPMLTAGTATLEKNTPGVALLSYTRRAVRNIARQMPAELKRHCLTFHKILEFQPETYETISDTGEEITKRRFAPARNASNPLPASLKMVVVDESSMVSLDLFDQFLAALPDPDSVQFIFLGDLNQLPPVYGHPILAKALLELPVIELTQVYRQALESPIIALAIGVKDNNFNLFNRNVVDLWTGDKLRKPDGTPNYLAFDAKHVKELITIEMPGRGKVTLQPWKRKLELEDAMHATKLQLGRWIDDGTYKPEEDLVLCPWGKSFGTDELNRSIAGKLGRQRNAEVFEILAGFEKYYYAVGDKILVDKAECMILEIGANPRYFGKPPAAPSVLMDRWGNGATKGELSMGHADDFEAALDALADVEDRTTAASHYVRVRNMDTDLEITLRNASELNGTSFAYAITVHKAQGSECRKVFLLTHYCHSAMLFRELVYTAITRAAEELHILMSPMMLSKAASNPRIKGDTLQAKLEFYAARLKERPAQGEIT